jgi:hypothetical protein
MAEWYDEFPDATPSTPSTPPSVPPSENWYDKFPDVEANKEVEAIKPKNNIFSRPNQSGPVETALKGLSYGTETALGYSLGAPLEAIGESLNYPKIAETGKKVKDFFVKAANEGWEAPKNMEIFQDEFKAHPIQRTIFNVASSAPLMAGAMLVTAKTGNPTLGASVFGPAAFGQHYEEQRKNGVPMGEAINLALANAAAQIYLEASIPLSGWLKGGTPFKRVFRGIWQEGGEEVLQQFSENALRMAGFKGGVEGKSLGQVASEISEGAFEAGIAGAVMGGLMGSVTPPTVEDVKYDAKDKATKIIQRRGKQEGLSEETINDTISVHHAAIDDFFDNKKKFEQLKEAIKQDLPYEEMIRGTIENTGFSGTKEINDPRMSRDAEVSGLHLARQLFNDMKITPGGMKNQLYFDELPQHLRDFFSSYISKKIEIDKTPISELKLSAPDDFREIMEEPMWIISGSTKQSFDDPGLLGFFTPLKKWITAYDMGRILHSNASVDPKPGQFSPFSFRVATTREAFTKAEHLKGATTQAFNNVVRNYHEYSREVNASNPYVDQAIENKGNLDDSKIAVATDLAQQALDVAAEKQEFELPKPWHKYDFKDASDLTMSTKLAYTMLKKAGLENANLPEILKWANKAINETPEAAFAIRQLIATAILGKEEMFDVISGHIDDFIANTNVSDLIIKDLFERASKIETQSIEEVKIKIKDFLVNHYMNPDIYDSNADAIEINASGLPRYVKARLNNFISKVTSSEDVNSIGNMEELDRPGYEKYVRQIDKLADLGSDLILSDKKIPTGQITPDIVVLTTVSETPADNIATVTDEEQKKKEVLGEPPVQKTGEPPPPPPTDPPKTVFGNDDDQQKDNNDLKATIGKEYDTLNIPKDARAPEVVPRNIPIKIMLDIIRMTGLQGPAMRFLEQQFGGEDKMRKALFKKDFEKLQDEIITNVYGDKIFRQYADEAAREQFRPIFETVYNSVAADMMGKPEFEALKGQAKHQAVMQRVDMIFKYMPDAHEEIFSKSGNWAYDLTDIGRGGPHPTRVVNGKVSNEAAVGFTKRIMTMAKDFQIPLGDIYKMYGIDPPMTANAEQLIQYLQNYFMANRPELAFFKMIAHPNVLGNTEILQRVIAWTKAEVEYPLLERMLQMNVYKTADMYANAKRGFVHKVWDYTEEQKRKMRGNLMSYGSQQRPASETLTYQEFLERTGAWTPEQLKTLSGVELTPLDHYAQSMIGYVRDSLMMIQQMQTLNWTARMLLPPGTRTLKGFEGNKRVNRVINNLKMAEWESSRSIKILKKITGKKENAILQDLGYIQAKDAPGLVRWYRGAFQDPYLYGPLADLIHSVYEPHNVAGHPVTAINNTFNFAKRIITMNPFDSTFLWMTAVLVNSNPLELATIPGEYFNTALSAPFTVGPKMLKGQYIRPELEGADYSNLPLFIRHGFTAFNYESAMKNIWDEEFKDYPEWNSPWENKVEYMQSFAGINQAIFNHFISQKLYHVINKRYEQFKKEIDPETGRLMESDVAARRAVKLITDTSGILNTEVFGRAGKWWTLGLFTRNLTAAFARTLTGAAYPLLKNTGVYKYRTGGIGKMFNPVIHGETSQADLAFLAKYYVQHIGKVITAKILIDSLLQYALSFLDDDEKDEHGEVGKGNPLAKKRFMFMNESGKRFSVRSPWKDWNKRRIYFDFQFLREADHLANILGGIVSKDWGYGPKQWFMNRLNTFPRWMAAVINNIDDRGQPITDKNLPSDKQLEDQINYLLEELTPIGPWKPEPRTGKAPIDAGLMFSEAFGASIRRGIPLEAGMKWTTAQALKEREALSTWFSRKERQAAENLPTKEALKRKLTPEQRRRLMIKRTIPTIQFMRQNKAAIFRSYQKEKEEE